MGNCGAPRQSSLVPLEKLIEDIVSKSAPYYYVKGSTLTDTDIALGRMSWKLIVESPPKASEKKSKVKKSRLVWFCEILFDRLFTIEPAAKTLFQGSNLSSHSCIFTGVITTALRLLENRELFRQLLISLVNVHRSFGIAAIHYGIFGEALLWSLGECLGPLFDERTERAWIKIYSHMLHIILPAAAEVELATMEISVENDPIPVIQSLKTKTIEKKTFKPF